MGDGCLERPPGQPSLQIFRIGPARGVCVIPPPSKDNQCKLNGSKAPENAPGQRRAGGSGHLRTADAKSHPHVCFARAGVFPAVSTDGVEGQRGPQARLQRLWLSAQLPPSAVSPLSKRPACRERARETVPGLGKLQKQPPRRQGELFAAEEPGGQASRQTVLRSLVQGRAL